MWQDNHFREVCRSARIRVVHNVEQETNQNQEEDQIYMVNINYISFNINCSTVTVNLKTSSNEVRIIVPYKVDTDSEGNIMLLHMHKKLFPEKTKEQLAATRNTII